MKYKITRDIHRISLHDSSIVNFVCSNDSIVMVFDWAKITNYEEENLTALILGNCELRLNGIRNNFLEKETSEGKSKMSFPNDFPENLDEVLKNVSKNDNDLRLNGFMTINGDCLWVHWQIEFEKFEFTWDSHVTQEAWKQGAMP